MEPINDNLQHTILLVEDTPDHAELIKYAILSMSSGNEDVFIVEDGQEALDYLRRSGSYKDPNSSPRPDLIFLDLKLPRVHGMDVLREIKQDEDLKLIPVIVLTTSTDDSDVERSYELGANSFIAKPTDFRGFLHLIRGLTGYWFDTCALPSSLR